MKRVPDNQIPDIGQSIMRFFPYRCSKRFLSACVIFFCSTICSLAQIKGRVVDDKDVAVEGAAVVALQLPDSIYLGGALSDQEGGFVIKEVSTKKSVVLRAEAIGYEKTTVEVSGDSYPKIILRHNGIALDEVVVEAPKLTVSPGKFTFYPGDIIKDVNDAFSVLKYVPLTRLDEMRNDVSILGEATKILINGKEPIMSSDGIMQMLRGSDAARIKKVELILQPGIARQGEGPILNIVIAPRTGSMGTADLTMTCNQKFSSRLQSWYGGEWDKWQFSANIYLTESQDKRERESTYTTYGLSSSESAYDNLGVTSIISKHSTSKAETTSYSIAGNVGTSVDLGHDNSLGMSVRADMGSSDGNTTDVIRFSPGDAVNVADNRSKSPFRPGWILGRLNYDHNLDSLGSQLRLSAFYQGHFDREEVSFIPVSVMQAYKTASDINAIQVKGDWNKYFNDRASIDLGFDSFHDRIKRQMRRSADGSLSGLLSLDDDLRQLQTQFDIFLSGEYEFSSLFSMSAGARGRWYRREIDQYVQSVNRKFEDFYILPTLSASFAFNQNNMATVGYTATVEQPRYFNTNPISYWLSPDYYYTGNPDLKASNVHTFYLNYFLLQKINFGAKGILKDNLVQHATLPGENGVTYQKPMEVSNSKEFELTAGYSDAFFSHRWSIYANATYNLSRLDDSNLPVSMTRSSETNSKLRLYLSTDLTLGSDRSWSIGLAGSYQSPVHTAFNNHKGYGDIDLTIFKHFKFGGRLMVMFYNILNHKTKSWYDCEAYSQSSRWLTGYRSIVVKFDISFGKSFRMRSNPSYGEVDGR